MNIRRTSGLIIPEDHSNYLNIKEDLTRKIITYNRDLKTLEFFKTQNDGSILIPRYYNKYLKNDNIIEENNEGISIDLNHNIIPRNKAQEEAIDFLINNNSGVLKLEPGRGKTVISICAIVEKNIKTIILAHKKSLIEQWESEFLEHTNINKSDILILNSKKYKKIKDKKIIISTPHVIAYNIENEDFIYYLNNSGIGMFISDECHTGVGPEFFTLASLHLNTKYNYGLSATPVRRENSDIIYSHLGELKYIEPDKKTEIINPEVYVIFFDFGIYKGKRKKYISWGGKFNRSRYIQQAINSKKYIKFVRDLIKDAYKKGRNTLVLGYIIKVLNEQANFDKKDEVPKEDVGMFIPGMKDKDKLKRSDTTDLTEAFQNKRIVYSTYGAGRDGNSRNDLDCLIMTFPTSNIEQAIGRIQRVCEGKDRPIVVDLVDTGGPIEQFDTESIFVKQYRKRKELYEEKGWYVKEIFK